MQTVVDHTHMQHTRTIYKFHCVAVVVARSGQLLGHVYCLRVVQLRLSLCRRIELRLGERLLPRVVLALAVHQVVAVKRGAGEVGARGAWLCAAERLVLVDRLLEQHEPGTLLRGGDAFNLHLLLSNKFGVRFALEFVAMHMHSFTFISRHVARRMCNDLSLRHRRPAA